MFDLPETFLQLTFVEEFIGAFRWVWPLSEVLHFLGLILLVGIITVYDLRLLGVAKRMPVAPMNKLLPWAVLGFCLCVFTGLLFVTGLWANVKTHPLEALQYDHFLQLKLAFILLAGINLLVLYQTDLGKQAEALGPGDDAPPPVKIVGAASLVLWIGVVYWGRLIPWGL
ncbi:MAG: hypothetical protein QF921_15230 [Pseudomonadales bacterium]|jgi:hypothetical protein|nr:hypothetical protein [Pseudomonadales bacterium]MDP6470948.1 hypothetical protein [Pseudomonadales bacterium]MDP6825867.1 hypothetical protein [Pseudomonadales bacterium]MDP6972835.1 hypothetical protein [Pseudomonadales bacterium]|tara:strand:+ start:2437 stop:2946 length:510 start_codon:yes stop_codon:yes gene_type:complete